MKRQRPTWLLSKSEIISSPSCADGMTAEIERKLRKATCEAISEIGKKVLNDDSVIFTAMVLFNRFVCQRSMVGQDSLGIAIACLLIAGKATDFYVNASRCSLKTLAPEYLSNMGGTAISSSNGLAPDAVNAARETIAQLERQVLFVLEYDVHVDLPLTNIQDNLPKLTEAKLGDDLGSDFINLADQLAKEMLYTSLCVRFDGKTLALTSIIICLKKQMDNDLSASKCDIILSSLEEVEKRILDEALVEIPVFLNERAVKTKEQG